MPKVTSEEMNFPVEKIAEMWTWGGYDGFTADTCGSCKASANVLAGTSGWFCPCGDFNSLPWQGHQIPHENPIYGPPQAIILEGHRLGETNNPNHWKTQYLQRSRELLAGQL